MTVTSIFQVRLQIRAAVAVDRVEREGYAVLRDVEDTDLLRRYVRAEARRRGHRIRTGTARADARLVWVVDAELVAEEGYRP